MLEREIERERERERETERELCIEWHACDTNEGKRGREGREGREKPAVGSEFQKIKAICETSVSPDVW